MAASPLQQDLCLAMAALPITTKAPTGIGPAAGHAVIAEAGSTMAVAAVLREVSLVRTALGGSTKILTAIKRLAKRAHRANFNLTIGGRRAQIVLRGNTSCPSGRRAAKNAPLAQQESIRVKINN
jgi:hypothetical protein